MKGSRGHWKPLLLSGIPASGKSTFGRWLSAEHGMDFIDAEEPGQLELHALKTEWEELFAEPEAAMRFTQTVKGRSRATVLAWGFPVEYLSLVASLKRAGWALCWFDGDRAAARESFLRRGDLPIEAFDRQMANIEGNWPRITELFADHIIESVRADGSYILPIQIYKRMFD